MRTEQALPIALDASLVSQLQRDIKEEIYKAIKISKTFILRHAITPLIDKPARRFSELMAGIDCLIRDHDLPKASKHAISQFCDDVVSVGEESIPSSGPLIVASNHPGTYDGFAILSNMPRNDVKLIVSGIPFFRNLPNACEHLIYSTHDTLDRMDVLRKSIHHLKEGGALLIFPSGRIDPDPSVLPGAKEGLTVWSKSVELFLRKLPQTNLVLAITSGVLSDRFISHPFTKLFKDGHERRRVMEFMQVIRQMVRRKPLNLKPKVTFAEPILARDLFRQSGKKAHAQIVQNAHSLMDFHINRFYPGISYSG